MTGLDGRNHPDGCTESATCSIVPLDGVRDIDIIQVPLNHGIDDDDHGGDGGESVSDISPIEEFIIIGAGTSSCIPNIACLVPHGPCKDQPTCMVCLDAAGRFKRTSQYTMAHGGPPDNASSRNLRTNPSAIIRYRRQRTRGRREAGREEDLGSILIDCGKSFYGNALKNILRAGVTKLEAVLLTHGHADAILGLDDLRHWSGQHPTIQPYVDVYCDQDTYKVIKSTFPYIVDPRQATGGGEVSSIRFHTFCPGDTIKIGPLHIETMRVCHGHHSDGSDYYAVGYRVGGLLYLSDLSGIPEETRAKLADHPPPAVLVADCLFEERPYKSHHSWAQSRELVEWLKPMVTILVGMAHSIDYYDFQRRLLAKSQNPSDGAIGKLPFVPGAVYVGFDGLTLRFK
jgi:phosphoribosyl 1,2-cyclic phosphodiesterase